MKHDAAPLVPWHSIVEPPVFAWCSIIEPPVFAPPEDDAEEDRPEPLPEPLIPRLVEKTPWWSISLLLHAAVVLFAALFWAVEQIDDLEAIVVAPPRPPRPVPEMDPMRRLLPDRRILDVERKVEDPVYRKDAEEADRNETDDDEEFQRMKGAENFVSDRPFNSRATYDVIGGGGGGSGRYGSRFGGKMNLATRGGGGRDTEDAVLAALKWLSRHQSSDGSWDPPRYSELCNRIPKYASKGRCSPERGDDTHRAGVTGLALLAFLGAGYSHFSKETHDGITFGHVVRKSLQWIIDNQDEEGFVGQRIGSYMYDHAICALALSEAYGLTGSSLFQDQAQKAIDFLVEAQNPGAGWRYRYRSSDNDTSVTGWAVMALKSADLSGFKFPKSSYDGARKWLDRVTDTRTGCVGYTSKSGAGSHPALTAVGVMSRIFIDKNKSDLRLKRGCDQLLRRKPSLKWSKHDFYFYYYASLALYQFDGPGGPVWKAWNEPMKNTLLKLQKRSPVECKDGSWEPYGRWCNWGGRVYATAINALTLEVYYRYANVFGGSR